MNYGTNATKSKLLTNTITIDTYNFSITNIDHFGSLGHLENSTHVLIWKNYQIRVVWPLHTQAKGHDHVIVRAIDSHSMALSYL